VIDQRLIQTPNGVILVSNLHFVQDVKYTKYCIILDSPDPSDACPLLASSVESCTQTLPSHYHFCSARRAQITSLRSNDLVVPNLPACGLPDVSDGGDLSLHQQEVTGGQFDESCARYSRLWCGIWVSPLMPPFFTYEEGVLLNSSWGLCASRLDWEKRKKNRCVVLFCCPC